MRSNENTPENKNSGSKSICEIEDHSESVIDKLPVEQERHQETFLHDLVFIATAYLKEREIGFTVDDIMGTWKKPAAQKRNAAKIFFSEHVFPSFHKSATDEKKLDYLVALFLRHVTEMIGSQALAELNKARLHKA